MHMDINLVPEGLFAAPLEFKCLFFYSGDFSQCAFLLKPKSENKSVK